MRRMYKAPGSATGKTGGTGSVCNVFDKNKKSEPVPHWVRVLCSIANEDPTGRRGLLSLVDTYWLNPNSGQLQFPSGSGSESYSVMLLHDNTQNQSPISDEPSMLHYPYLLRFFRDSTSAPLSGGISSTRNGESVFSTGRSSFPRSVSFRIIRGASSARSGSLAVWTASSQPPQAAQSIPSAQSPPAGSPRRIHPQPSVRREAGY